MRTLFEDTDEQADREEKGEGKRLSLVLWLVALIAITGAAGAYYWVSNRKPPEPPPVAVSLDDTAQISRALNSFNDLVKTGKWDEAQGMLSAEGLKRLSDEKKTLRESLLGKHKDDQVIEASPTASTSRTPSTVRVDCVYFFANSKDQMIVPLTVVKEDDRLLINSWGGS
jgi:hypothetical protein